MIDFKLLIAQLSRQSQTLVPQRAPAFSIRGVSCENSRCSPSVNTWKRPLPPASSSSRQQRAQLTRLHLWDKGQIRSEYLSNYFGKKNPCMSSIEGIGVPAIMLPLGLTAVYCLACKSYSCYTWQPIISAVHLSCLALGWCYLKLQDWFEFTKTLTNPCGSHIPRYICVIFITTKPQWI